MGSKNVALALQYTHNRSQVRIRFSSRHSLPAKNNEAGVRNADHVASCRRALSTGCAAFRPTVLSEELATQSSTVL